MTALQNHTLVLGGASSGKSALAEARVLRTDALAIYVATAQAFDDEMSDKIARHRARRGAEWATVEEPLALADAIGGAPRDLPVLVDCVTLWLTNLLLADADVAAAENAFVAALANRHAPVTIVSNEVGYGIVPMDALSRRFRAAQGALNQRLAAECGTVLMVVAGLPLAIKGTA